MKSKRIAFPARMEGESPVNYLGFLYYCAMGPGERTIERAYDSYKRDHDSGSSWGHWRKWSARFNWVDRAMEYDRLFAESIAEEIQREIGEKLTEKIIKQFNAFETVFNALNGACVTVIDKSTKIARLPIDESDNSPSNISIRDNKGNPVYMKHRKESIAMLKDLSTTLNNMGNLARNLHASWAELNGLAELKERIDRLKD